MTNPFKYLSKIIVNDYGGEIVTNAWFKFYEILTVNQRLLRNFQNEFKTFHLCEAPGAFIAALNHYLSGTKIKWKWYAQSLISKNSLGDTYGLIEQYPDNWIFEGNGDLTNPTIIRKYLERSDIHHPQLITADGGFSLQANEYSMEEKLMTKLFLGEMIMILGLLAPDGCAIVKMFLPFTESLTLNLLYIINCHFDRMTIQKPVTSKIQNSEIYIIMEGYHPVGKDIIDLLLNLLHGDGRRTNSTSSEHDTSKHNYASLSGIMEEGSSRQHYELAKTMLIDIENSKFRMFLNEIEAIRNEIIEYQIGGLINMYYNYYNVVGQASFIKLGQAQHNRQDTRDMPIYHDTWINMNKPKIMYANDRLLSARKHPIF